MSEMLTFVAGWGCVVLGLFGTVQAVGLIQEERRQRRTSTTPDRFSGREMLAAALATGMIGVANLLGGWWSALILLGVTVLVVLLARILTRSRNPRPESS
ncbi:MULTISPECIES: hypothetical protein [Micromonospora]|uniref:Uncharacterized protein n=1 Tax=Micromonospora yangpuensis TaxID=683228 RepID=A0A1C6V1H5_9ACTN|nr:hypothetical protein [Micromonospora yangpuensis]GGL97707.1 hypothetical protein GCM10012279_13970 [Micromonospora yangpuensis]SCL60146.1 hypothetical protein GA0070617_4294 [Micromonospora yangpuensis]